MTEENADAGLLYGSTAIAEFLGLTLKQCRHRIEAGIIPTFKIGGTTCATRDGLRDWLDAQARRVIEGGQANG